MLHSRSRCGVDSGRHTPFVSNREESCSEEDNLDKLFVKLPYFLFLFCFSILDFEVFCSDILFTFSCFLFLGLKPNSHFCCKLFLADLSFLAILHCINNGLFRPMKLAFDRSKRQEGGA